MAGNDMSQWMFVAQFGGMALFLGTVTWLRARRPERTPEQTSLMWRSAWGTIGFVFGAVLLASAILIEGDPMPWRTLYIVLGLVGAAAVLSVIGGFVHGWAIRRIDRHGPDPDYGDLDEIPQAPSDDGPAGPTQ